MAALATQWGQSLRSQFLAKLLKPAVRREDDDLPWDWYTRFDSVDRHGMFRGIMDSVAVSVPAVARLPFFRRYGQSAVWIRKNLDRLFSVRCMLADEESRQHFDAFLALMVLGPWRFRFAPKVESGVRILSDDDLGEWDLDRQYVDLPLRKFVMQLNESPPATVVTTRLQAVLTERFGQYFPDGAAVGCRPRVGDVVFDCGACVGDMSIFYASIVGPSGAVYAIDPVRLHLNYLEKQVLLNPQLAGVVHKMETAVSDRSSVPKSDGASGVQHISPGLRVTDDSFVFSKIDDLVAREAIPRVDLIKMDIEGAELSALRGAAKTIKQFHPRLAISAYHERSHLYEIPDLIKAIDSGYRIGFRHHSPVTLESVFYAW